MMSKHDQWRLAMTLRRQWVAAQATSMQVAVDAIEKVVFAIVMDLRADNPKFTYTREYEFIRSVFGVSAEWEIRSKWGHNMDDNRNGN